MRAQEVTRLSYCVGLRPDKLFSTRDGKWLAPYLQHVATTAGHYGVSHTRPPTESRPGHVAITAGFYEDPSALFSGWQANSVPFDSIFNHAVASWGLGAPDVTPLWDGHGAYKWKAYDAEMEDWSSNTDLFALDTWVLNETKHLLAGDAPLHTFERRPFPGFAFYEPRAGAARRTGRACAWPFWAVQRSSAFRELKSL